MLKYWPLLGLLALLGTGGCGFARDGVVDSYDSCVEAGNVVLRSIPPRCVTRDGKMFVGSSPTPAVLNQNASPVQPKASAPGQSNGKAVATPSPELTQSKEQLCKDSCGNGVCEQIVCQAEGCPCAESPKSCPQDCSAAGF